MVAIALAQELEEFAGLETSDDELCCTEEFPTMAGKTWFFGPTITEADLAEMQDEGYFRAGCAIPPSVGETIPKPPEGFAVVFKDFFMCGLRFPCTSFLGQVLEAFRVQLHHLNPNGFLTLSKFCWVYESHGAKPDIDTFCTYYELQKQPKKVTVDGVDLMAQYGSYTFMAKRFQGNNKLELSWCQKGRWDRGWMDHWFYMKMTGQTIM